MCNFFELFLAFCYFHRFHIWEFHSRYHYYWHRSIYLRFYSLFTATPSTMRILSFATQSPVSNKSGDGALCLPLSLSLSLCLFLCLSFSHFHSLCLSWYLSLCTSLQLLWYSSLCPLFCATLSLCVPHKVSFIDIWNRNYLHTSNFSFSSYFLNTK